MTTSPNTTTGRLNKSQFVINKEGKQLNVKLWSGRFVTSAPNAFKILHALNLIKSR